MEALYLLVPLSIAIVFLAIWVFFQASDSGQFDDLVGPGLRVLHDDDTAVEPDALPTTVPADVAAADAGVPGETQESPAPLHPPVRRDSH